MGCVKFLKENYALNSERKHRSKVVAKALVKIFLNQFYVSEKTFEI